MLLSLACACTSLVLALSFYRKYAQRLRASSLDASRYHRIGDYCGRPIRLAFEYRSSAAEPICFVEADVDEIYHYGRDYYLKGYARGLQRRDMFKWSRVSNPRVRPDGRRVESLDALFSAVA